jgi:hypothetical protein
MTEELQLIADALAYVTEVYREVTQENGAPTLGTQNQMVEFVLRDEALRRAAQACARRTGQGDATFERHELPPYDEAYWRVRERMLATMEGRYNPGDAAARHGETFRR